ncbi:MAG: NAD-dependent epimerase/dehydratase family protein [Rhizobiaceae bacterium]
MKAVIFGATGYVGSAVGRALLRRGCAVSGVTRAEGGGQDRLRDAGMRPLAIDYADVDRIVAAMQGQDIVVFSAALPWTHEQGMIARMLESLEGSGRTFLYTSGTGVLAIPNKAGTWDENVFAEDDPFPFTPTPTSAVRLRTEEMVRRAADRGLRAIVVRPGLIWGHGASLQIPRIFDSAMRTGKACYIGHGLNLYSNVHVDDLAEVFALASEKGVPGAVYHAVAGEANFRSLAEAVAQVVGCRAGSVTYEEACQIWPSAWVDMALAVNSRSRSPRTRSELGWSPKHVDVVEDIRSGSYRDTYAARTGWAANGYRYGGAHGDHPGGPI